MSCNTCGAATLNICTYTNGTVRKQFNLADGTGEAYDLTGWSAQMQVRGADTDTGAAELDINSTTATINGSVITFPTPTEGGAEIYISDEDVATLPAGEYVYDVVFEDAAGDRQPLVRGTFTVLEGVTE